MKTVSSTYLKMIYDGCSDLGKSHKTLDPALRAIMQDNGRNLQNPAYRYPRRFAAELLNTTRKITGESAVGIKVGMTHRPKTLLDIGYAFTLCDNLMDVMALNQRFQPLIQQIGTTQLDVEGESAWLRWTPLYDDRDFYAEFTEMIFTGYAAIGRWLLWDQDAPVLSMHFRHSAPDNIDMQKSLFCENLIYDSNIDGIEFVSRAVNVPMPNRDPKLLSVLTDRLEKKLTQLHAPLPLGKETMMCIQTLLPEGRPCISKVAKIMGMSDRTLRRRLKDEGQTYSSVLEGARKDACYAYMRSVNFSQTDIALALGYSDQTAFSRAFKSWHGESPMQYRNALKNTNAQEQGALTR